MASLHASCTFASKSRTIGIPTRFPDSLVVREEPQDLDRLLVLEHLVHEPVLDVDPSREGSGELPDELLEPGRHLEGIARKDRE